VSRLSADRPTDEIARQYCAVVSDLHDPHRSERPTPDGIDDRRRRLIAVTTNQTERPGMSETTADSRSDGSSKSVGPNDVMRDRDEQFRLIVESAVDFAIFTLDPDGRIASWNVGAERILGYSEQEILGKDVRIIFTPEDIAIGRVEAEMRGTLDTGHENDDRWHVKKGGVRFWANGTMMALTDDSGTTRGYLKILRDRTKQKLASDRLHHSEERLRMAVEGAGLGLWNCELPAGVMVWDDRCKRHLGVSSDGEGTLETAFKHVHADDRAPTLEALRRLMTEHAWFDREFRVVSDPGNVHWVQAIGRAITDDSGEACRIDGVTIEITERKQREEVLREADRRRDEFLATLAHELRNPLSAINNSLQLWLLTNRQEDLDWIKDVITRQTKHLTGLINDLLDISQINHGSFELRKEHIDLMLVVRRAVENVWPLIHLKSLDLKLAMAANQVEVFADPARMEQVILNLLKNAAKYTREGGHINLTVHDGDEVTITVTDDGVGIPSEMLGRIFDPLVQVAPTLDRAHGGLGVGLTFVKNLVELHGGTVSATSEGVNRGSQFSLRLPSVKKMNSDAQRRLSSLFTGTGPEPRRVLIVDDNLDSAAGLAKLLRLSGYQVTTATDGPTALEITSINRPEVILMDIGLPGMDGYQIAEHFRKQDGAEQTLVIATSGYGQDEDFRRSRSAGFDHHLVKPIDVEKLLELLRRE
jgi:PAS domain S-box-containing protein